MVSKELHFTKAAEKLGISQPTLSYQIKMLEQDIGYPLFNRVGKKIEMTKVGEIVQEEALKIKGSLQNITNQIVALSNIEIGELRIAVLPGEITDLTSTLCIQFNQLFPNVNIFIETTDQVEKAVLENRADFGIDFQLNTNDLLEVTKLYEEEFYLISNHPNDKREVAFASLINKPLILFPSMHQCRRILNQTSEDLNAILEPIVETSSIPSILNLVRSGIGDSVVSRTLFEFYDTEDLFFQTITQPSLTRTVYLVMKRNSFINYATREFITLLISEIKKLHFDIETDSIISLEKNLS